MKILNLILFFFTSIMFAQEISTITNLSNTIVETSGLYILKIQSKKGIKLLSRD